VREPEWEYTTLHLSAATLKKNDETLDNAELAKRLSEAIIEKVTAQKSDGWEPVGMEFHHGDLALKFRRAQTTPAWPNTEA
jgi:hypothetical protein